MITLLIIIGYIIIYLLAGAILAPILMKWLRNYIETDLTRTQEIFAWPAILLIVLVCFTLDFFTMPKVKNSISKVWEILIFPFVFIYEWVEYRIEEQ